MTAPRQLEDLTVTPETPPRCGHPDLFNQPINVGLTTRDHITWTPYQMPIPGDGGAHVLVGGSTGGGKTTFLDTLIANLAPRPWTALALVDPKMTEFGAWTERATTVALGPEPSADLFQMVIDEMRRRQRWCADHNRSELPLGLVATPDGRTWLWPRLIVIIDEMAVLTLGGEPKTRRERITRIVEIGNIARAFGIGLVCCTQQPDAPTVPTEIAQALQMKVALRCAKSQQVVQILGYSEIEDAHPNLPASPKYIPARKGRCWVDDGETTSYVQVAFLPGPAASRDDIARKIRARAIAAGTAHLRIASPGGAAIQDPSTGLWVCDGPDWPHTLTHQTTPQGAAA